MEAAQSSGEASSTDVLRVEEAFRQLEAELATQRARGHQLEAAAKAKEKEALRLLKALDAAKGADAGAALALAEAQVCEACMQVALDIQIPVSLSSS